MVKFLSFFMALGLCILALADDAPNAKVEKRLSDKNNDLLSNSSSIDPGVWNMVTSQISRKSYKTRRKESLMDISQMLFGDSHFWGKLWSLNKNITNPYEVPPGTVISLNDATTDSPPSIGVTFNAFVDPKKLGATAGPDLLGSSLNVEIPANGHEKASALNNIPGSLPPWSYNRDVAHLTKLDIERPPLQNQIPIKSLDYFVADSFPNSEGSVQGTEMHLQAATEYQYIFVKFDHEPKEKSYLVMKNLGKVETDFLSNPPTMVQILGSIEVLEKVDESNGTYRAMVTRSLDHIFVGASLVAGTLPTYEFTSAGGLSAAKATIIGGQHSTSRHVFGTESVVFLDHGKQEGLSEGQLLPVYKFQRAALDDGFVKQNPRVIGKIKIVKAMDHFSTAVVTDSVTEIEVGDGTSPDIKSN